MSRYVLPAIPLLAIVAAHRLRGLSMGVRALAWIFGPLWALGLSLAMARVFAEAHPAQRAADWISEEVAPRSSVASVFRFYPLLREDAYRRELIPDPHGLQGGQTAAMEADVVAIGGLLDLPLKESLEATLRTEYACPFEVTPRLSLLGLHVPEPLAPVDWLYSHPAWRVCVKRQIPEAGRPPA
jgi:hypothetical protein